MANFNRYIPDAAEVSTWLSALERTPLPLLMHQACAFRREGHGDVISFSPKVFVPVTRLCRDACGYCTFAKSPREVDGAFLSPDEILDIAHKGAQAGCSEALFTLGDHPEQRYRVAMTALRRARPQIDGRLLGRSRRARPKEDRTPCPHQCGNPFRGRDRRSCAASAFRKD